MEEKNIEEAILLAVGDVAPYRSEPETIFDTVRDFLVKGDIVFCQFEINLSTRGIRMPQARLTVRADPKTARAVKNAGFNVVSFASNHCMDWGAEAFFDTIEAFNEQDLPVVGVGKDIKEARKPVILDHKSTRVAFLAYNSILPQDYWAEADRPGCAPMRAFTVYEQIEHDQPGTPCRVHSFAKKEDLDAMIEDIESVRSKADIVIVSHHWGLHFVPGEIADYQFEVGHAAIDAGADLVLGHHAHILKGMEIYKGKAIFYSLSNFALDVPLSDKFLQSQGFKETQTLHPKWEIDPEYPTFGFPPDSRKSFILKCIISEKEIKRISLLPVCINKKSQPEILAPDDERFTQVVKYMEDISKDQGLDTHYRVEGDEVIITDTPQITQGRQNA